MHEINSLLRRGKNPAVLNAIKLSVRRQMQSYLSRFVLFKGMSMSFSVMKISLLSIRLYTKRLSTIWSN